LVEGLVAGHAWQSQLTGLPGPSSSQPQAVFGELPYTQSEPLGTQVAPFEGWPGGQPEHCHEPPKHWHCVFGL
jgi:hypothetical protein